LRWPPYLHRLRPRREDQHGRQAGPGSVGRPGGRDPGRVQRHGLPEIQRGRHPEGLELIALIITFGSFLAAASPIITALFGIVVATMSMTALVSVVSIAGAATSVATMLGISCGIDYALFILSRHCAYILAGHDPREATDRAVGSAGSSVAFAGLSVIIALCGLSVAIPILTVMGLGRRGHRADRTPHRPDTAADRVRVRRPVNPHRVARRPPAGRPVGTPS
jgi:hypothetical protein